VELIFVVVEPAGEVTVFVVNVSTLLNGIE
jgi:hypothetical protein